jgi:porphobilinogen synthase
MRRLRKDAKIRELVSEVHLSPRNFIFPVFVKEKIQKIEEIPSMPGQYRYPVSELDRVVEKCVDSGIYGVLVFGIPEKKDDIGTHAFSKNGIVQEAVRIIKEISDLIVFTDVCLCQYTSHGHCGVIREGKVDNDATLEILSKIAISHAEAGADFVSPSAMMDGQVGAIRRALDESGFQDVGIMAYSAKFASSFYGPFREAAESAPKAVGELSDRSTYQMDFRSSFQALREMELDAKEGADILMVKPALPYLDIIKAAREKFALPIAAYQVSGEYLAIKLAAKTGVIDEKKAFLETFYSIKRAGADIIISYAAPEVAKWLK